MMWICWMLEGGKVNRERIAAPVSRLVLEYMRREYPGVTWWLVGDDDGMEWTAR